MKIAEKSAQPGRKDHHIAAVAREIWSHPAPAFPPCRITVSTTAFGPVSDGSIPSEATTSTNPRGRRRKRAQNRDVINIKLVLAFPPAPSP